MPTESLVERVRAAWRCVECRRYRRTALTLGVLFLLSWALL